MQRRHQLLIKENDLKAMYFNKTSIKRTTWRSCFNKNQIKYEMTKIYEMAGFIFQLYKDGYISITHDKKEIAIFAASDTLEKILDDETMLKIAFGFIGKYKENVKVFAYQNTMTSNMDISYMKIAENIYLQDSDPEIEDYD